MKPINLRIAEELSVREQQITAAISLLDGGAIVPFVARYRKEATGGLDGTQLRALEERLRYLRELNAVVEVCVNAVGVDVNTASTPLLSRVSGIGEGPGHDTP